MIDTATDRSRAVLTAAWAEQLARTLKGAPAIRLGEATVLSHRVHLQRPDSPGEVQITGADAGQTFYGRTGTRQIVHADVFHASAAVEQRQIAREIIAASERWFEAAGCEWHHAGQPADYIDIQTGAGGGRVSGSLTYGQKAGLRRTHMNHLHIASGLPEGQLPLLIWLIAASEEAIARQGVEIRRVERIIEVPAGRACADLSEYADVSDSLLREERMQSGGEADTGDLAALVALADEFGGVGEAADVLAAYGRGDAASELRHAPARALNALLERGLIETDAGRDLTLSSSGERLRRLIVDHRREVELEFRRLIRRVPLPVRQGRPGRSGTRRQIERTGPALRVRQLAPEEWPSDIAPAETIGRAYSRALISGLEPGGITGSDICIRERGRPRPLDICLLIDASASMAGKRIKAARYLAEHLLLATRDRVAVVTFQERQVEVRVPLTRSYERAAAGLRQIRPQGLTPLAQGLLAALDYLKTTRADNPMILLVTDGIPTVPEWTLNPIGDACRAAAEVARARVQFTCIGLEPNREFLGQLTTAAHGRLHIVSELERDQIVQVVHRERGT